jgi:hypothetical protein
MSGNVLGPRTMRVDDARAILVAEDITALALMYGYARSYAAVAGALFWAPAFAVVAWYVGWTTAAVAALVAFAVAGWVVMEARRRARQWEAVIQCRLQALNSQGS